MLDAQVFDSIGDGSCGADVACVQHVGDVAVNKDVAGTTAEDGCFGHAGVGTAEPEDGGRLSFAVDFEEARVCLPEGGGPFAVRCKMFLEVVLFCSQGDSVHLL